MSLLAAKFSMNCRLEYSAAVKAFITFIRSTSRGVDRRLLSLTAAFAGLAMGSPFQKSSRNNTGYVKGVDDGGTVVVVVALRVSRAMSGSVSELAPRID